MKLDRQHKAQKLEARVPGFVGYGAVHHAETDLLLRRFLANKIGEVRDRLADFVAVGTHPPELREKLACALKTTAFLKAEVSPENVEFQERPVLSPVDEELLLDFDLVLLDKVAALPSQLDLIEAAGAPKAVMAALDLYEEGLAEVDDIFQKRRRIFKRM